MLLFRSEEEVQEWCVKNQRSRGEVLTLNHVWELSKVWYGSRMRPDFRGRSIDKVIEVFEGAGLTSAFWKPTSPPAKLD